MYYQCLRMNKLRDKQSNEYAQKSLETSFINELNNINIVNTIGIYHGSRIAKQVFIDNINKMFESALIEQDNIINEDYDWFVSGELNTDSYKGQHIAIWKKQIVGSGETPLEAERIAKAYYGRDCKPAVVYIPKDEEIDTIF